MKECAAYEVTVHRAPICGRGFAHTMLLVDWPSQTDIVSILLTKACELTKQEVDPDEDDLGKGFEHLTEVANAMQYIPPEPENLHASVKVAGILLGTVEIKLVPAYGR